MSIAIYYLAEKSRNNPGWQKSLKWYNNLQDFGYEDVIVITGYSANRVLFWQVGNLMKKDLPLPVYFFKNSGLD
jgi:hypothetical protein